MAVHSELKNGFLEPVYQEALEHEFNLQKIPYEREKEINIFYKGHQLTKTYKADFICYNKILIELKAVSELESSHYSQVINYLNATKLHKALLINFGKASLEFKSIVL